MTTPDSGPSLQSTSLLPSPSLADITKQPNGAPNDITPHRTPTPQQPASQDDIQLAKEKARATLSATLHPGSASATPSRVASKSPSRLQPEQLNGASPSRKRSRSGSPIEKATATTNQPMPDLNRLLIDQYTFRDQAHAAALRRDKEEAAQIATEMSQEKAIWEDFRRRSHMEAARRPTQTLYPAQRRRPAGRRSAALRVSKKDLKNQAEQLEDLVPVRLDLEHEKLRLRDTFTWNVHDRTVPPEIFAQGLVEDFKIPPEASEYFAREVYSAMQEQIGDYHPHVFIEEEPLDPHLPYHAYKNDEMRIQIKLNITIGQHTLVDQFDWDINSAQNSPETFAAHMSADLALTGEFTTAIAHCIREQTQQFTKGLYIAAHPFDGRPVEDAEVRDSLLPSPLTSAYRPFQAAKDYAPYFYELNAADLERTELAFSREQRQQKRSTLNRRGGPSLPDFKEKLKTWRTMVVSSVVPGAAPFVSASGIYRQSRTRRRPWNAGSGGAARNGGDGVGDDDDMLSGDSGDDSQPEAQDSPARNAHAASYLAGGSGLGTSRTRGMRGAASAAQAAMRANLARSVSPDSTFVETRAMSRRLGAGPIFESIDEATGVREGLTVKLKVPRERFRQWWREWKRLAPVREAEAMRARQMQAQAQAQAQAREQMAMQAQQQQQQHIAQMRAGGMVGGGGGGGGVVGPGSGGNNIHGGMQGMGPPQPLSGGLPPGTMGFMGPGGQGFGGAGAGASGPGNQRGFSIGTGASPTPPPPPPPPPLGMG